MGRMRASSEGGCRFLDPRRVLALALEEILDFAPDERSDGWCVGHCVMKRTK